MTFSTIPAVEVEPELLERLEGVLREGETLESFVIALKVRRIQAALLVQGEAPWQEYQRTGVARLVNDVRVFFVTLTGSGRRPWPLLLTYALDRRTRDAGPRQQPVRFAGRERVAAADLGCAPETRRRKSVCPGQARPTNDEAQSS
jgi:hypothetical protein